MNVKDIKNLKRVWAFEGNFATYETANGKAGIINRQGEIIFPDDKYDFCTHIENGIFHLQVVNSVIPAIFFDANLRKEVESPSIPSTEKPQLPAFVKDLDGAYWCARNRVAYKVKDRYGIMDEQGNILVAPQYAWISYAAPYGFKNDRIVVKNGENLMGYINLKGEELIPCKYKYLIWCKRIRVYKFEMDNGKWGLMNSDGEILIPAIYDSIDANETNGLSEIAVSKDGCCYFINERQKEVSVF